MTINEAYVTQFTLAKARNDSNYARVTIKGINADLEETKMNLSIWGVPKDLKIEVGSGIRVTSVDEKDGFHSCKFQQVTLFEFPEDHPLVLKYKFQLTSREDWDKLSGSLLNKVFESTTDEKWHHFIAERLDKLYGVFSKHPAAKTNHHAYVGGLMDHVYQILQLFDSIYDVVPFKVRPEVVIIGILYHDLGKCVEYRNGTYVEEFFLMGHIYIGAHHLQVKMESLGFSYDDVVKSVHVVLAHHNRLEHGSPVKPATSEAFLVHTLDLISGHGTMFENTDHMENNFGLGVNVIKNILIKQ